MNNLKEFKALIVKYESITIKDIEKAHGHKIFLSMNRLARILTGFGSTTTCSLCDIVRVDEFTNCVECAWLSTGSRCNNGYNSDSYCSIAYSYTHNELLEAFKARAKYMRSILKE